MYNSKVPKVWRIVESWYDGGIFILNLQDIINIEPAFFKLMHDIKKLEV
jgi:hypothetical protein